MEPEFVYPVVLSLSGRAAVVVGAGPVGTRKAAGLVSSGARVRVVDPAPGREVAGADRVYESYRADHLDGAALVVAAATTVVNTLVMRDASERGIWACDAISPDRGGFIVPAVHRVGRLTIAVGTGGVSPVLARTVRDRLAADYDSAFAAWLDLLAELRPLVSAAVASTDTRRRAHEILADWGWQDRIRSGTPVDQVRSEMWERVRSSLGGLAD